MSSARRCLRVLALLLAFAPAAAGAEAEPWGYDMADELMSPFCPGRALSECPSPQASELREWIIEQERSGASKQEVESELFRVYGDQLLQAPRVEGVGIVAYAVPLLVFLLGGALVVLFLRGRRAPALATVAAVARDPELERAIDAELQREVDGS